MYHYISRGRYLIVIDNLWSATVWDIISQAFPEGSERSRIIITTHSEDVALICCCYHSEYVFEMRPLDDHQSRLLFIKEFACSGSVWPENLTEVAKKIVETCGGLPLATATIASLLAWSPVMLMEQWIHVCDSLSSHQGTKCPSETMKLALNHSYNNLPQNLQTCLLYLNMYPEGWTVYKDDLVKLWLAEGFINATEGRDLKKVAGSYFDELTEKRFIQPECIKHKDEVVSCSVHELVLDLIQCKSLEENFIVVMDCYRKNVEYSDMVHRIALHFRDGEYTRTPGNIRISQVRSLHYFGLFKCMPSIKEYKLLRILTIQLPSDHSDETLDLTEISELFLLKYLKVVSDACIELPNHMRGLQYLETLDICAKVASVPSDIIHLPCLLYLHLPFEKNIIDWIGSMTSASVRCLGKLIANLQDLCLTFYTIPLDHLERNMEALGTLIGVHGNLKTIALRPSLSQKDIMVHGPSKAKVNWDGFGLPLLQRFEWSLCNCTFFRVPKWIGELSNLCILKIAISELFREDVNSLKGLHALAALSLYVHAAQVERIIFDKVGFSVLKYLKIWCSLPWLQFDAEAMPKLQKLKLGFNAHKAGIHGSIPICIDHLPGLNHISATIGGRIIGAEAALMAAISNHPNNTRINVQLVDWTFYSDEGISMTPKEKQQDTVQGDEILEKRLDKYQLTQEDGSLFDQNKQVLSMVTEEQEDRTPKKQNEFVEITPYEFAVTDEDKNKEATIRYKFFFIKPNMKYGSPLASSI